MVSLFLDPTPPTRQRSSVHFSPLEPQILSDIRVEHSHWSRLSLVEPYYAGAKVYAISARKGSIIGALMPQWTIEMQEIPPIPLELVLYGIRDHCSARLWLWYEATIGSFLIVEYLFESLECSGVEYSAKTQDRLTAISQWPRDPPSASPSPSPTHILLLHHWSDSPLLSNTPTLPPALQVHSPTIVCLLE